MTQLSLVSDNKDIRKMSFEELKNDVIKINLNQRTDLKMLHHQLVTELNYKKYEKDLDKKNKKKLGNISRIRYNQIVAISDIIFDDIFVENNNIYQIKKEKFNTLKKIIKK